MERLYPSGDHVFVLWQNQWCKTLNHIGETSRNQQDAQDAGEKARAVHQQPEGKKPKTPEYFGDTKSLRVQIQEKHGQGIALRLVKYGEEIGAANEDKGRDGVQLIQQHDGERHHDQSQHERGVPAVDTLEEVIESQGHANKKDLADKVTCDAGAKERFGNGDVGGC